jgi:hypothetical protein
MDMAISNMPKEISGEFRGDTLFASYTLFKVAIKKKHIKSNGILKRETILF